MKKSRISGSPGFAKTFIAATLFLSVALTGLSAQVPVEIWAQTEGGAIKLLKHTYRVGTVADGNDTFDFVKQGGQEILYFFDRYTLGATIADKHEVSFLYQPLELVTDVKFKTAVKIDNVTFAANTPMQLTYSFPFYRTTSRYRFLGDSRSYLSGGLAIQLRNASIRFEEKSGANGQLVVSQNLGIVPALSLGGRLGLGKSGFLAFEATGSYASSSFFNGADFQFEGSILDASVRGGIALDERSEIFLNGRFFGGSASGTSQYPDVYWTEAASNTTENIIAALSLTAGATLRLR
ncbi:MAG: hypothetical protein RBT73_12055 [Spirochaetia bacterium]|jgi:hypothetical protein|nr:hypothetical protein [Spirochaetia bacterium]